VLVPADPAAAAAAIDPPSDAIASAWYRRRMTELFVRRALEASHAV
jgi:CO/xanthine dehydrogenase FAD-binding subunit